MTLWHCLFLCV
ncbi:rCG41905 [Rattus norvegicus]|uniref:RCG41905 n=1 Tax=Rattus norvegicus TaxID=10116 RepID=A6KKU2_RAT|nr:rCG41905 [Rattus norvegicus]